MDFVSSEAPRCLVCGSSDRTGKQRARTIVFEGNISVQEYYTRCADCGQKRLEQIRHHGPENTTVGNYGHNERDIQIRQRSESAS